MEYPSLTYRSHMRNTPLTKWVERFLLFVVPHLLVESPCVNIQPSFLNDILISDGAQSTLLTSYNP